MISVTVFKVQDNPRADLFEALLKDCCVPYTVVADAAKTMQLAQGKLNPFQGALVLFQEESTYQVFRTPFQLLTCLNKSGLLLD